LLINYFDKIKGALIIIKLNKMGFEQRGRGGFRGGDRGGRGGGRGFGGGRGGRGGFGGGF